MSSLAQKEIRTMKDFVDETEMNLLECKVCFEKYSQQLRHRPKNLPCGHIMCEDCVSSLCRPGNPRPECPFCRRSCRKLETSVCLPILHLLEIMGRVVPGHLETSSMFCTSHHVTNVKSASFNLGIAFGGWGVLFNPTGIALCKQTKCLVVAHDGKSRIAKFTLNGMCTQQIGGKDDPTNSVLYPIDVAVTLDGYLVVTDAGDCSIKVFTQTGKCMLVAKQPFSMPWGVAITSENDVIISDPDAGNLVLVSANFENGSITKCLNICSYLSCPREIAVCQSSGAVTVVEHLAKSNKHSSSTRVKILSSDMKLIRQIDSFSLSLFLPLAVHTSGVAFDQKENVLLADVNNRCVICLNKMEDYNSLKHVVASGLSYPVALAVLEDDSIAVLDSGNNSVLLYSP